MPSSADNERPTSTYVQGYRRITPSYAGRAIIVGVVIAVWGLLSILFVSQSWLQGIQQQQAGISASSSEDTGLFNQPTFRLLLQTARTTCPSDKPLLLLNDGSAANQLSDYYLYPRRVISVNPGDPFGTSELEAQRGGCIATFGAANSKRLDSFKDKLDEKLCAAEGCLYTFKQP